MTADLLRRAATKLREHANATNFGAEGWIVDLEDSEVTTSDGGMMIADTMELNGERPDASYIALMHPPVALALADWLQVIADDMSDEHAVEQEFPDHIPAARWLVVDWAGKEHAGWTEALAVARAILREPEDGAA